MLLFVSDRPLSTGTADYLHFFKVLSRAQDLPRVSDDLCCIHGSVMCLAHHVPSVHL